MPKKGTPEFPQPHHLKSADVLQFTGSTVLPTTTESVLDGAKESGLQTVIVLGHAADGRLYFSSSHSDLAEVLLLLKRGEMQVVSMVEQQVP